MWEPGFLLFRRENLEDNVDMWSVQGFLLAAYTLRLQLNDNIKDGDEGAR